MKKFAAMLLTGVMVFSLAACGGSTGASSDSAPAAEEPAAEAPAADAAAEAPAADAAAEAPAADAAAEAPAADAAADTEFIVGFDAEYPPYGYLDEATGDYTGFDLQLAEELCKRRGWTLVKQPINWDNKDAELDSGTIDCIWNGMTYSTPERINAYTWSKPYVNNSIVIAVVADSDIQTPADLAGKVVIAQSNSSAEDALKSDELAELAGTFAELQRNPSYDTCFMDLKAGAVDAVAVDIGVARYQMRNNPDTFRILDEPISTEQYAIAFKLGNEALRDQVQETYDEMLADGTVMKIAQNYADDNLPDMLITE
ncbi:MAG: amino acid ABC transporter substrate-binding protein [Lachnospiraceae bacterium]|nr:amino acid ABC transporter substrate-binding protein [Lachnospiraceae bacterium]